MSCCYLQNGIMRDCDSSIGGIKRVWISCYQNAGEITDINLTNEQITSVPGATNEPATWFEFKFRKQTCSATQTWTVDDTNGIRYLSTDIVLQFAKQDTAKRNAIMDLAKSDVSAIIQDENGDYWYYGNFNPLTISEGTAETGTSYDDFNGYNITMNNTEKVLAYEVTKEAMNTLLNPPKGSITVTIENLSDTALQLLPGIQIQILLDDNIIASDVLSRFPAGPDEGALTSVFNDLPVNTYTVFLTPKSGTAAGGITWEIIPNTDKEVEVTDGGNVQVGWDLQQTT